MEVFGPCVSSKNQQQKETSLIIMVAGGGACNLLTPHYVGEIHTEGCVARVNKEKRYRVISGLWVGVYIVFSLQSGGQAGQGRYFQKTSCNFRLTWENVNVMTKTLPSQSIFVATYHDAQTWLTVNNAKLSTTVVLYCSTTALAAVFSSCHDYLFTFKTSRPFSPAQIE